MRAVKIKKASLYSTISLLGLERLTAFTLLPWPEVLSCTADSLWHNQVVKNKLHFMNSVKYDKASVIGLDQIGSWLDFDITEKHIEKQNVMHRTSVPEKQGTTHMMWNFTPFRPCVAPYLPRNTWSHSHFSSRRPAASRGNQVLHLAPFLQEQKFFEEYFIPFQSLGTTHVACSTCWRPTEQPSNSG